MQSGAPGVAGSAAKPGSSQPAAELAEFFQRQDGLFRINIEPEEIRNLGDLYGVYASRAAAPRPSPPITTFWETCADCVCSMCAIR